MPLIPHRARHTVLVVTVLAALALAAPAAVASAGTTAATAGRITHARACAAPAKGRAACLAIVDQTATGRALTKAEAAAAGLDPYLAADLQSAYNLPSALLGERQTIAIVDAFDDPNAEADLAAYRAANNLPPCTTANGCFKKVNQDGQQGPYPAANPGWALEESLDVDMASAVCPNCSIDLVESTTNQFTDLTAAEDEAAALGANVISNSYGSGTEYPEEATDCKHYDHPGIAITASAGDSGFGVNVPAVCPTVTAVGGTTLFHDSGSRGWAETAWSGTGSGCSAYIAKPSWQRDRLCGKRTTADVSAVADTQTPVAVYDTYRQAGWLAVGGTSVAAPLVGGVYALAGNTDTIGRGASWSYAHTGGLYDVTSGTNGACGGSYLCTGIKGYDGPTGLGTPDGIGAF